MTARRYGAHRRTALSALSAALLLGGGTALGVGALVGGPAGADTTLGGFTVSALAEGSTAQYEQPNFPVPSTPSLEFDEGYAATSDNYGPTGSAVASTIYPGQVVANAGPELALLVPGAPLPPAPVWPVDAISSYPSSPNTASQDQPGVNMDASSTADANTASASLGDNAPAAGAVGSSGGGGSGGSGSGTGGAGSLPKTPDATSALGALSSLAAGSSGASPGNPLGSASSLIGIGFSSGTSTSGASGGAATASATATDSGVSILGGLITIGGVTSTAKAISDGTTGSVTGSTVLTGVNVAGEAVTIDGSGIHAAGSGTPAIPISSLNSTLSQLGVSLTLTNPTDTVNGPSASRTLDGLKIAIDLTTLDNAANQAAAALPSSLTSNLPLAVPNKQLLTLDLGTVTVSSAAAPGFNSPSGNSGSAGAGAAGSGDGGTPGSPGTDASLGTTGNTGAVPAGTAGTSGNNPGGNSSTTAGKDSSQPASAITPIFTGIGAGFVLLGLLAAAALAYGYKRVDDATELVGPVCADGDPLSARFLDGDDSITDAGGTGS